MLKSDETYLHEYTSKGNNEAFAFLFQKYHHLVFLLCLKYLKDEELAKDISMNVFEKLFKNIHKYEIKSFKPWLFQSAKNTCLMYLRDKKDWKDENASLDNITNEEEEIDHIAIDKREEKLRYCVGLLKEAQKKCIELFFFQKKRYDYIATQMGIPSKQVKSHLQNAKKNLKNCLNS